MKKALAALLASFVGLFGYQIVDKAIEERVNNLEYQVSSQQEEIESLHHLGKYGNVNEEITLPSFYSEASSLNIGDTQKYTGQTKFLFREYADGSIVFISTSDSNSINDIKIYPADKISFKSRNEDQAEIAPAKEETPKSEETPAILPPFQPIAAPSTAAPTIPATTRKEFTNEYLNDYYLYITDASRTISGIEDITTKVYDKDYSTLTQTCGKKYTVKYSIKGKTDKKLAGNHIRFYIQDGSHITSLINNDGALNGVTNTFRCQICGKKYENISDCNKCIDSHRDSYGYFVCNYCGKKFENPDNYILDLKNHIIIETDENYDSIDCYATIKADGTFEINGEIDQLYIVNSFDYLKIVID